MRRSGLFVLFALPVAVLFTTPAAAAPGDLSQKPGAAGCIAENPSSGTSTCTDGIGLTYSASVAVSPDGKNAYVASQRAVAVFDRNPTSGTLTQKSGLDACTASTNDPEVVSCRLGDGLDNSSGGIAISPDGKNVYAAFGDGFAIFNRNTTTGVLTQTGDSSGCWTELGLGGHPIYRAGECEDGRAIAGAKSIAISFDGKVLYVASDGYSVAADQGGGLAIFDRNTSDGTLTQKAGAAGCVVHDNSYAAFTGCAEGRSLRKASSVAISPDSAGKSLYVSAISGGVAVFDRSAANGQVTQKAGTAGCVVEDNSVTEVLSCAEARALDGASSIAISPDDNGKTLYVGGDLTPYHLAILDRDTNTGTLTQKAGTAGCVAKAASFGCAEARALSYSHSPVISTDGKSLFLDSYTGGILSFDRNTTNSVGALTQRPGTRGCLTYNGTDPIFPDPTPGPCAQGRGIQFTRGLALSPDGHNLYSADDLANSIGVFDIEADNTPPETTITSGPTGTTGDSSPSFSFSSSETGSSFSCSLNDLPAFACTSPKSYPNLSDGNYTFSVRATDLAGNTDSTAAIRGFTVDTTPPETIITSGPAGPTNDSNPSFSFSTSDFEPGSTFTCAVYAFSLNTFEYSYAACHFDQSYALSDGKYMFFVRATDEAGNTDSTPATRTFTVDTKLKGSASAPKKQKQKGNRIVINVKIEAREDLDEEASGWFIWTPQFGGRAPEIIRAQMRTLERSVASSSGNAKGSATKVSKTLKLVPKKNKDKKKIVKALKRGEKVTAKVTVELTDNAGNKDRDKLKVKLKAKPKKKPKKKR